MQNLPAVYRPISLLNTRGKIFKKLLLNKILEHINENDLLNRDQFGFRKKQSMRNICLRSHIPSSPTNKTVNTPSPYP